MCRVTAPSENSMSTCLPRVIDTPGQRECSKSGIDPQFNGINGIFIFSLKGSERPTSTKPCGAPPSQSGLRAFRSPITLQLDFNKPAFVSLNSHSHEQ
eukprot:m.153008 g.153008  ORF g.153008 m.153008 type:complete len:98 (-) comp30822_c0_seq4:550-843(-)